VNDEQASLLCVHAHPDDESLWTGGVLARAAAQGVRTAVVTCTNGELPDGASSAPPGTRAAELAKALGELRAEGPHVLRHLDSGPEGRGTGSLCAAPFDAVVDELAGYIRRFRPVALATYDAFGVYGHPDHIRVHRATVAAVGAAACAGLPGIPGEPWAVRQQWWATLPAPEGAEPAGGGRAIAAVDVRPWPAVKWRAVRAHDCEFARGAGIAALEDEPGLREQHLGTEYFEFRPGPGGSGESPAEAAVRALFE
jgi:N-acetyl-1-D-myo-inositol-2-amino-2-deoxy-alpha-D-glucopyranoside deacetylase